MNTDKTTRALVEAVEDLLTALDEREREVGDRWSVQRAASRVRDALELLKIPAVPVKVSAEVVGVPNPFTPNLPSVPLPSVGRIVHVFAPSLVHSTTPAIIYNCWASGLAVDVSLLGPLHTVDFSVLNQFHTKVPHVSMLSEQEVLGRGLMYWKWPERT